MLGPVPRLPRRVYLGRGGASLLRRSGGAARWLNVAVSRLAHETFSACPVTASRGFARVWLSVSANHLRSRTCPHRRRPACAPTQQAARPVQIDLSVVPPVLMNGVAVNRRVWACAGLAASAMSLAAGVASTQGASTVTLNGGQGPVWYRARRSTDRVRGSSTRRQYGAEQADRHEFHRRLRQANARASARGSRE